MCEQTGEETLVLKSHFNLTTIIPLETADLFGMLGIFAVSMGTLQMLPLILENSPFRCIIAYLLNSLTPS